ncbi:MAG: hypothetical protein IPM17_15580 [Verrucomicrobia bacterium]|nr:hypothetical protein [Verrucomicrobiota bacterium]
MNRLRSSARRQSGSPLRATVVGAVLGVWLAFSGAGCNTNNTASAESFAVVTIPNRAPGDIATAICQVFGAEGYSGGVTGRGELVFEKLGSRGTTVAREGVVATRSGAQTIIRVRVEVIALAAGAHRLQCKAFIVRGGSDPFFQDEVGIANRRSGPYQDLLNQVVQQLETAPPPESAAPRGS